MVTKLGALPRDARRHETCSSSLFVALAFHIDGLSEPAELVRRGRHSRRWRLRAPSVRGQPKLAKKIERWLEASPEIESAEVDPRSGSILVVAREPAPPSLLEPARVPARPARRALGALAQLKSKAREASIAGWHSLTRSEVCDRLATTGTGLTTAEARRRLRRFGLNELESQKERSRLAIFASQLANVPTALLAGSSVLSSALGELFDAAAIVTVIGLNGAIGYAVERANEKLIASWRRAEAGEVEAIRDGEPREISAAELVPGDVIALRSGDVVPADARVLEAHRLSVDEAPLTGESEPQSKQPGALPPSTPLGDRTNLLHAGTTVAGGHGRALVVATGPDTEMARVRQLIEQSSAPKTPLARRLDQLSNKVAKGSFVGAGVVALAGLAHRRPLGDVLRGAVALGVAALPEGLPVVSTAALVRSMSRMRKDGMVVRRLSSAETLGGVTVICCDKTGTLTQNRMQLDCVDVGQGEQPASSLRAQPHRLFDDRVTLTLAATLLNSDVEVRRRGREILSIAGSSTESALVMAAHQAGLDGRTLRKTYPLEKLLERSAGVHYVVSLHRAPDGGRLAFVKGAPEQVAELCDRDFDGPLDDAGRARILERNDALASDGLRVLAIGWRRVDGERQLDRGFTYLGMVGLRDPLRPGARDAVEAARRAGIRTVIVTGDQRRTAEAIARQLGLDGEALDGEELRRLAASESPADRQRLQRLAVVSRVAPADKLSLVEALRRQGEIVAMAGDGINDAPALKVADVGIAVGRAASDLARHVADVVLAGDDLRSILAAVAEGRIVQDNLRRAVRFLFATNFSELALVMSAALLGAVDPLTPLQLLWINLLTDTLPALALALEPGDRTVLDRPPASPSAPILTHAALKQVARDGALIALAGGAATVAGGRSLGFGVLTGAQLAYTVSCRAPDTPPSSRFVALVGGTIGLQVLALTLAPLRVMLSLQGPAIVPIGGFVAGFAVPWFVSYARSAEVIVRVGRHARAHAGESAPARACEPVAAAPQP